MDGGAWCPWGHKESDTTEGLHFHFSLYILYLHRTINLYLYCEGTLPLEYKSLPVLLLSMNFLSFLLFFLDQKQTLNVLKYIRSVFHLFKVF